MRILVTGGAGFIGSHLVRRLLASERHQVVNLDALCYSGNLTNLDTISRQPGYEFVHGDICDGSLVSSVLRKYRIEGIINCAAETHVDRSILDPGSFARTDVVGTGVLLEEGRHAGVKRFLQVSTDEVYGSVESGLSTEEDRVEPRSPYSASKAGGRSPCVELLDYVSISGGGDEGQQYLWPQSVSGEIHSSLCDECY